MKLKQDSWMMFIKLRYIIIIIINNYIDGKIWEIFWKIITGNLLENKKFCGKIVLPHITILH